MGEGSAGGPGCEVDAGRRRVEIQAAAAHIEVDAIGQDQVLADAQGARLGHGTADDDVGQGTVAAGEGGAGQGAVLDRAGQGAQAAGAELPAGSDIQGREAVQQVQGAGDIDGAPGAAIGAEAGKDETATQVQGTAAHRGVARIGPGVGGDHVQDAAGHVQGVAGQEVEGGRVQAGGARHGRDNPGGAVGEAR